MELAVHEEKAARALKVGNKAEPFVDEVKTLRPVLGEIARQNLESFRVSRDAGSTVINDVGVLAIDVEHGAVGVVLEHRLNRVDQILDRVGKAKPLDEVDHEPRVTPRENAIRFPRPYLARSDRGHGREDEENDR